MSTVDGIRLMGREKFRRFDCSWRCLDGVGGRGMSRGLGTGIFRIGIQSLTCEVARGWVGSGSRAVFVHYRGKHWNNVLLNCSLAGTTGSQYLNV